MSIIEGGIVNLQHGGQSRVERPAIGHKFGLVKHLERSDGAKRYHQEDGGAQKRYRNVPECLKAISSIDRGGFNQFLWQILQGGYKVDHKAGGGGPHVEYYQGR